MKFTTTAVVATFAAVAAAQDLSLFPTCAISCLLTGIKSTTCSVTDIKCACNASAFRDASASCFQTSCQGDDLQKAITGAYKQCQEVGVTIPTTLPGSGPASTSSAVESSTTATVAPSSTSVSASESTATASAPASYSVPESSSIASTVSTASASASAPASYSAKPSTTASGNSSTTVPTPPANTNGAASFVASGALAAVGVVAALFL